MTDKQDLRERNFRRSSRQFGGAAMEYVIVSTFAAFVSIVAIGFVARVFKEKVAEVSEKLGLSDGSFELGPFTD